MSKKKGADFQLGKRYLVRERGEKTNHVFETTVEELSLSGVYFRNGYNWYATKDYNLIEELPSQIKPDLSND